MKQSDERAAWDSVADAWRRWWGTFEEGARPLVERLLERAQVAPDMRVLDLGCGIGEPALSAARQVGPSGHVLAIDLSERMLRIARERACEAGLANISFYAAEAHAIAADAGLGAAVSRWVLMLTPDPAPVAARVRAALAPGANAAFAVWAPPEEVPFLGIPRAAFVEELGAAPPAPDAPGPFSLCDAEQLADTLRAAGFEDVAVEGVPVQLEFDSGEEFARFVLELSSSARRLMAVAGAAQRERFERVLARRAEECSIGADCVRLTNLSWVASARRPG